MIFALDKRNGRVIWSEKAYEGVPRAKRHVKATQANSTPVTDGRYVVRFLVPKVLLVYVLSDNGALTQTGQNIYHQRLPTSFSASPVAADGRLYR